MYFFQIPASVIISNTKSSNSRNNINFSKIKCSNSPRVSNSSEVISQTVPNVTMAHLEDNSATAIGEKIKPPPQFSDANSGQPAPRLIHPKKRKFDAAEFEDNKQGQSMSATTFKNGNSLIPPPLSVSCTFQNRIVENSGAIIAVTASSIPSMLITDMKHMVNGQQSENVLMSNNTKHFKVQNQATITPINAGSVQLGPQISYQPICIRSISSAAPTKPSNSGTYSVPQIATTSGHSQVLHEEDIIDLSEWCNHRILAKRKDHYASGVIRSCDGKDKIHVEFDPPNGGTQIYQNIFNVGRFDIVSDASPSISDVSFDLFFIFSK